MTEGLKGKGKLWTEADDRFLREWYGRKSFEWIAGQLGRLDSSGNPSRSTISGRARRLGLKGSRLRGGPWGDGDRPRKPRKPRRLRCKTMPRHRIVAMAENFLRWRSANA